MFSAAQSVAKIRDENYFVKTRARLQRLGDLKFFAGWIESINHAEVRVRFKAGADTLKCGDKFSVEVNGKDETALFLAEVSGVSGQTVDLVVPNGITLQPKKENARFVLYGLRGRLGVGGAEHAFTLVDVSETGMGLLLMTNLERGTVVEFELFASGGSVAGRGEVRYSRSDPEIPAQFRIGIELHDFNRIERARWQQLLNSAAV